MVNGKDYPRTFFIHLLGKPRLSAVSAKPRCHAAAPQGLCQVGAIAALLQRDGTAQDTDPAGGTLEVLWLESRAVNHQRCTG